MANCASISDLKDPLEYIYNKYCLDANGNKKNKVYLIGNSMGAGIVANYLADFGGNNLVDAACCVQPPMKYWMTMKNIDKSLFGFYNWLLVNTIYIKMTKYIGMLEGPYMERYGINLRAASARSSTIRLMDVHINSITCGYTDSEEYYDKISCVHGIPNI